MDGVFLWHGESLRPLTGGPNREGHGGLAGRRIVGGMRRMAQGSEVVGVVSFIGGEPMLTHSV